MSVQTSTKDACCVPGPFVPRPRLRGQEAEQRLAALTRALGHPARIRILKVLLAKDVCVAGELVDEVPLAASTVSQHLKVLKEVGLIRGEVDGPRRCYCVDRAVVEELTVLLGDL